MDGVATSRRALHEVRVFLHKDIVTGATHSTVGVLKNHLVINWKDASGPIQVDRNTVVIPPKATTKILTDTGPSSPLISKGSQKIEGPRRLIIRKKARSTEPLDASIDQFLAKSSDPAPCWSKIIRRRVVTNKAPTSTHTER